MKKRFYKHLVVLMLVIVSCSKDDTSEKRFDEDVPVAEGEDFYMTLKTARNIGEKIYFEIFVSGDDKERCLEGVWIDANANGKRDVDEGVSKEGGLSIVLKSKVIRIYGEISVFYTYCILKDEFQSYQEIYSSELTDLDVSTNSVLEYLDCSKNKLKKLDISKCKVLNSLSCVDNQLTELDVSANSALEGLSCGHNQLKKLDVRKCEKLWNLICDNNQLRSLDVRKCEKLRNLFCDNNQLTSLDVSKCKELLLLYCNNNQLTSLDVSKCKELWLLYCSNNQLTSLDITSLDKLSTLSSELSCIKATQKQIDKANERKLKVYFEEKNKGFIKNEGALKISCE